MIGKPQYSIGDIVKFKLDNKIKTGIVAIVDDYGTFYDSSDVSYDILNRDESMFYKHVSEKYIVDKIGEMKEDLIWEGM